MKSKENKKQKKNYFIYLLYRVERCIEQKKDPGWMSSRLQKILFYLEIIPKHQQIKRNICL
jgi:hypothetical protein